MQIEDNRTLAQPSRRLVGRVNRGVEINDVLRWEPATYGTPSVKEDPTSGRRLGIGRDSESTERARTNPDGD